MVQMTAKQNIMKSRDSSPTPGTLIDGARMYAASADAVNERLPNAVHVLSHLLGMSIELTLKAYLLQRGRSVKELKGIGHNLGKLFDKSVKLGLYYTGSRSFRTKVLGASFQKRVFAYPEEGMMNIITPRSLREISHELIQEVFPIIKGKDVFIQCQNEPGICIKSDYPDDVFPSAWATANTNGN